MLHDFTQARQMLHTLATKLGGDRLSPTQSLRLPGSHNTKAGRNNALCEVIVLRDVRYTPADFGSLTACRAVQQTAPPTASTTRSASTRDALNPVLLDVVTETLIRQGYRRSGDWLSGPCLFPQHHRHGDQHPSFGFNMRSGYANCYRCGSLLLKDLCQTLGIYPADYGGICKC